MNLSKIYKCFIKVYFVYKKKKIPLFHNFSKIVVYEYLKNIEMGQRVPTRISGADEYDVFLYSNQNITN